VHRFLVISFFLLIIVGIVSSLAWEDTSGIVDRMDVSDASLEDVLTQFGDPAMIHSIATLDESKAKMGEDLIYLGRTNRNGKKTRRISNYFVCTDCHNMSREFENLGGESTNDRLSYAEKNGLSFLPGSTLWGIYNRTSFYNDDYVQKYGDLVVDARDTLANAVQLCAKYCSSGRYLKDWELEAIMHYFKKDELQVKDLDLTAEDRAAILRFESLGVEEREEMIKRIKQKYRQSYSATFLETQDREKRKYGEGGDVSNGKSIYEKACMYCHENKRVTYLHLDNGKLSGKMFWNNLRNYSDLSLYQIIRHGTYSKTGRKQYMPLYTEEKMSDAQLNDLVAYIKQIAKKK
jgi:mono/diheme cytochrome c family protein